MIILVVVGMVGKDTIADGKICIRFDAQLACICIAMSDVVSEI